MPRKNLEKGVGGIPSSVEVAPSETEEVNLIQLFVSLDYDRFQIGHKALEMILKNEALLAEIDSDLFDDLAMLEDMMDGDGYSYYNWEEGSDEDWWVEVPASLLTAFTQKLKEAEVVYYEEMQQKAVEAAEKEAHRIEFVKNLMDPLRNFFERKKLPKV